MINKDVLINAINDRENGIIPNFSDIELNCAVDAVLYGLSIDEVCEMDEEDIYYFLDCEENSNDCDYYICPVCGSKIKIEYDGENYEGYEGECNKCGATFNISSYVMDDMDEDINSHDFIQRHINNIYSNKLLNTYKRVSKVKNCIIYDNNVLYIGLKIKYNTLSRHNLIGTITDIKKDRNIIYIYVDGIKQDVLLNIKTEY